MNKFIEISGENEASYLTMALNLLKEHMQREFRIVMDDEYRQKALEIISWCEAKKSSIEAKVEDQNSN